MGLRIKGAQNGDTPLTIVHRLMTEEMGEQTPIDKARVANDLLSQGNRSYVPVDTIEDLSEEQLALLAELISNGLYG